MTITEAPTARRRPDLDLDVTLLSGTIGAEIRGVDLTAHLDDDTVAAIRQVWLDRKVVFFPGQHLDADRAPRVRRAASASPPRATRSIPGHRRATPRSSRSTTPRPAELYAELRRRRHPRPRGIHWHTDVTFVKRPPLGSILRAVVDPRRRRRHAVLRPAGGVRRRSARRCRTYLAHAHRGARRPGPVQGHPRRSSARAAGRARPSPTLEPVEHPVVRTHPETGARVAVREPRLHLAHQGASTGPRATRCSAFLYAPLGEARVHRALPLARRRRRLLGQPHHPARGRRRLRRPAPGHPAGHAPGRRASVAAGRATAPGWESCRGPSRTAAQRWLGPARSSEDEDEQDDDQ